MNMGKLVKRLPCAVHRAALSTGRRTVAVRLRSANRLSGYTAALTVPITRGMSGAQQNNARPWHRLPKFPKTSEVYLGLVSG